MNFNSGMKLNLFLEVTGRRIDGYHTLDTIFLRLKGGDSLEIFKGDKGSGLTLECSDPSITGETTLHKCHTLLQKILETTVDVHVKLDKRVPTGSGLGAGSADAATLLWWAWEATSLAAVITTGQLMLRAVKIGADVPVFLAPPFVRATSVGEVISPIGDPPDVGVLLVCPPQRVETATAFQQIDELEYLPKSSKAAIADGLPVWENCFNRFEDPARKAGVPVDELKEAMMSSGAIFAQMTGSGSAVFGIFPTQAAADAAADKISVPAGCWIQPAVVAVE